MSWEADLAYRMQRAKNGEKGLIMQEYGNMTGLSRQQLYRIAAAHGYCSGRKRRSDAGSSRLNDEQILFVAGLIDVTSRQRKGSILPVERALELAFNNGVIEHGAISVRRMTEILREREISSRDLKEQEPYTPMKSLHPNHVHLVDASICIQYYIRRGKGLRIMPWSDFYKNKPQNFAKIKKKIIRYVVTDHYSHHVFVKYYEAEGENQADLFDVLCSAWKGGAHGKLPFRGVPQIILMDAGSSNTSKAVVRWLDGMDVKFLPAPAKNPRRQGSVERAQDLVERWFEAGLSIEPADSIEQLNAWAADWMAWFNGTRKHSRHGMTRTECWLKITQEQLREMPDMEQVQELFAEPEVRRVVTGERTISMQGETYSLRHIDGIAPRHEVWVVRRPLAWPEITVRYRDLLYTAQPILRDAGGFAEHAAEIGAEYKAPPETTTMQRRKEIQNRAYGEDPKAGATPYPEIRVYGNQADQVRHDYMPRKGVPLQVSATGMEEREESRLTVIRRMAAAGGPVAPLVNQAIRERFGSSIPAVAAEELVAAHEEGLLTIDIVQRMGGSHDTAQAVAH